MVHIFIICQQHTRCPTLCDMVFEYIMFILPSPDIPEELPEDSGADNPSDSEEYDYPDDFEEYASDEVSSRITFEVFMFNLVNTAFCVSFAACRE